MTTTTTVTCLGCGGPKTDLCRLEHDPEQAIDLWDAWIRFTRALERRAARGEPIAQGTGHTTLGELKAMNPEIAAIFQIDERVAAAEERRKRRRVCPTCKRER